MNSLAGKRILVVDDEPLIAMLLEDILGDLGCVVVGPALDVDEAEALAREAALDAAILDVHLGKETCHSIAELLRPTNPVRRCQRGRGSICSARLIGTAE